MTNPRPFLFPVCPIHLPPQLDYFEANLRHTILTINNNPFKFPRQLTLLCGCNSLSSLFSSALLALLPLLLGIPVFTLVRLFMTLVSPTCSVTAGCLSIFVLGGGPHSVYCTRQSVFSLCS